MRAYGHDQTRVRQRLLARDPAVELAQRRRARGARGRERLKSQSRHDARRAAIPDVGNHEDAGILVQRAKAQRLAVLARHDLSLLKDNERVSPGWRRRRLWHNRPHGSQPTVIRFIALALATL